MINSVNRRLSLFSVSLLLFISPFTKAETLIIEDKSLHEIPVADAKVIAEDSSFFIRGTQLQNHRAPHSGH